MSWNLKKQEREWNGQKQNITKFSIRGCCQLKFAITMGGRTICMQGAHTNNDIFTSLTSVNMFFRKLCISGRGQLCSSITRCSYCIWWLIVYLMEDLYHVLSRLKVAMHCILWGTLWETDFSFNLMYDWWYKSHNNKTCYNIIL